RAPATLGSSASLPASTPHVRVRRGLKDKAESRTADDARTTRRTVRPCPSPSRFAGRRKSAPRSLRISRIGQPALGPANVQDPVQVPSFNRAVLHGTNPSPVNPDAQPEIGRAHVRTPVT